MVEHLPFKEGVLGSNPRRLTSILETLRSGVTVTRRTLDPCDSWFESKLRSMPVKEKTPAEQRLENEGGPPLTIKGDARIKTMTEEIILEKTDGLYLLESHDLKLVRKKMVLDRPLFVGNYITDEDGIIAIDGAGGPPKEIKNSEDWARFQELQAQADIIITGADYLNRFAKDGEKAQNILSQFDKGAKYEDLGDWRIDHGYKRRNPDVAVVSRSLDFDFLPSLLGDGRRLFVFTTFEMANSEKAEALRAKGAFVEGVGKNGVNGKLLSDKLQKEGYEVAKMTTGPRVLQILLDAGILDRLYVTQVQRKIPADPNKVLKIPVNKDTGEKTVIAGVNFKLITPVYRQDHVKAKDGNIVSQKFLVYERQDNNG